jgi:drug/metabolite transporter (DMT)-like permease
MKYFQRARLRHAQFHCVADADRRAAALPAAALAPAAGNTLGATYAGLLLWTGALASGFGFVLWVGVLQFLSAGTASLNMLAIPVIALLSSMAVFDEKLSRSEWIGIGCIGAGLFVIVSRMARHSPRRAAAAGADSA